MLFELTLFYYEKKSWFSRECNIITYKFEDLLGTKLCARGKAAAKAKFDVYPSAYSNGFAVQVCKGTKAGLDGKKRCSPPYC